MKLCQTSELRLDVAWMICIIGFAWFNAIGNSAINSCNWRCNWIHYTNYARWRFFHVNISCKNSFYFLNSNWTVKAFIYLIMIYRPAAGENAGVEITLGTTYSQCSLYMRELQNFVARIQLDYFSRSSCPDLMNSRSVQTCDEFHPMDFIAMNFPLQGQFVSRKISSYKIHRGNSSQVKFHCQKISFTTKIISKNNSIK